MTACSCSSPDCKTNGCALVRASDQTKLPLVCRPFDALFSKLAPKPVPDGATVAYDPTAEAAALRQQLAAVDARVTELCRVVRDLAQLVHDDLVRRSR